VTFLPDTNVLLAIAWPNHQHHRRAHSWFEHAAPAGWATCALTELGFVRLSSSPAFTRDAASPSDAIELLVELCGFGKHAYWAEDSFRSGSAISTAGRAPAAQ